MCKHILFPVINRIGRKTMIIKREEKYGGDIVVNNYEELAQFVANSLVSYESKKWCC
jgi:hypothetical protein